MRVTGGKSELGIWSGMLVTVTGTGTVAVVHWQHTYNSEYDHLLHSNCRSQVTDSFLPQTTPLCSVLEHGQLPIEEGIKRFKIE